MHIVSSHCQQVVYSKEKFHTEAESGVMGMVIDKNDDDKEEDDKVSSSLVVHQPLAPHQQPQR